MERSFIVTKESNYYKDLNNYIKLAKQQKCFIRTFFKEKGIEAKFYTMGANGGVNIPFDERYIKDIYLDIEPTENDLNKFSKMLCKPDEYNLRAFRKSSKILKEFSQKCIDEKVVINLSSPRVSDYFRSLQVFGCSYQQFEYEDKLYIRVDSEHLKDGDTPNGFIEIKLSEYYKVKENAEEKSDN